jgi:MFS transporter, FHS family, Na+ dependent glucose transporter 1
MDTTTEMTNLPPVRTVRPMAATLSYYAAFIALGLMAASLGPTLPGLAANTNTRIDQISLLFTARSGGYFLGSLLGGRLYDRMTGHMLLGAMLLLMAATMALTPLVGQLWVLVALLLVMGVAEATVDVGGNAMLGWIHRGRVGPYMNALHFFFGVGAFISPIVVAQAILLTGGITGAYWVLALLMAPVALWVMPLASPHAPSSVHSGVTTMHSNRFLLMLCVLFMLLYVGAEVSFGGWIFTYAVTLGIAEAATAAYLTSVFWGALTLGRLASIPLAARLRPSTILLSDLILCIVSVSAILFWGDSSTILWLGAIGLGLGMASIFPTILTWAGRRMTMSGAVTSWFLVGSSIGAMTFPWLIGQLFEPVGPHVTMVTILLLLLADCAVFGALMFFGGPPHAEA